MVSEQTYLEISQVIYRYSHAMDAREWQAMDEVFTPEARIIMGGAPFDGRDKGVAAIRGFIGCCSITHHMNGNILILSANDEFVRTTCNFRAWHRGTGARADDVLECMGTYRDTFRKTADGWRIVERDEVSPIVIGDIESFFADAGRPEVIGATHQS